MNKITFWLVGVVVAFVLVIFVGRFVLEMSKLESGNKGVPPPPNFLVGEQKTNRVRPIQPINLSINPEALGVDYLVAAKFAVSKCGEYIELLEYRIDGFRLEGGNKAVYSFTRGKCSGNILTEMNVYTDTKTHSVIGDIETHGLGGDDREPLSNEDLANIKLTAEQASQISGLPVFSLFKRSGSVVWRATSMNGPEVTDKWVNVSTGEIVRNITLTPSI